MTSGSLWNFYGGEINDDRMKMIMLIMIMINNNKTITSKYFEYNTKKILSH